MGDIEAMFHQVKVTTEHCDFLRFLWWPDGKGIRRVPDDHSPLRRSLFTQLRQLRLEESSERW